MRRLLALLLLALAPAMAWAHVGSKDVFETVNAGPYTFYVTVRPPNVIPGVATVEIRSTGMPVTALRITPLPVTGEAAKHPPAADTIHVSEADPNFYTGSMWIMAQGTWQVRIQAQGPGGEQVASVPVLAVPIATLKMQRGMGWTLGLLGLVLLAGMGGIVAASVQESRLAPGLEPTPALRRRGLLAMALSAAIMVSMVLGGGYWWNVEAAAYGQNMFVPTPTTAVLTGNQLDLNVTNIKTERRLRSNADYLPDHGKLMHLYAIRQPEMDAAFHLHPELVAAGDFRMSLPDMPPGRYSLYGDVVHATGLPETLLASIQVPAGLPSAHLSAEDAEALPAPLSAGLLTPRYKLPDGYTMVWNKPASIGAGTAYTFDFTLLDPEGKPATDMQPYLGMAGHAAFVKTDGRVFAHTHPEGSAAMADVMLARQSTPGAAMADMQEPQHLGPEVGFPYGFPTPGRYRIFVQMKHAGTVETGVFDAQVQ